MSVVARRDLKRPTDRTNHGNVRPCASNRPRDDCTSIRGIHLAPLDLSFCRQIGADDVLVGQRIGDDRLLE
jgi:hypothetical protein